MQQPRAVLGIDAAWTEYKPSGIALVVEDEGGGWRCAGVAPSYQAFEALGDGHAVDWDQRPQGSAPRVLALLECARKLVPAISALTVAVDMPLATVPITCRRRADDLVAVRFGGQGCATHSPDAGRPGPIGEKLTRDFFSAGWNLAPPNAQPGGGPFLLEVFPHTALLALLPAAYRVPYKVSRAGRYWPEATVKERIARLLEQFEVILAAIKREFVDVAIELPAAASVTTLSKLKRHEDALDALVAAWVGVRFLEGGAEAFGDDTSAVWCPMVRGPGLAQNPRLKSE